MIFFNFHSKVNFRFCRKFKNFCFYRNFSELKNASEENSQKNRLFFKENIEKFSKMFISI